MLFSEVGQDKLVKALHQENALVPMLVSVEGRVSPSKREQEAKALSLMVVRWEGKTSCFKEAASWKPLLAIVEM